MSPGEEVPIRLVLIDTNGNVRCFDQLQGGRLILEGPYEQVFEEVKWRTGPDTRFRNPLGSQRVRELPGLTWMRMKRGKSGLLFFNAGCRSVRTCVAKTNRGNVYPSLELAELDAKSASLEACLTVRAYHCDVCGKFHTGKPDNWNAWNER